MEKKKQAITLKIAGRSYLFDIERDKEEVYRLAEREVNANISRLQKTFGENCDIKDCLAISALQFCINNIAITHNGNSMTNLLNNFHLVCNQYDC